MRNHEAASGRNMPAGSSYVSAFLQLYLLPGPVKYQIGKNIKDYGGTYNLGSYDDTSARPDLANPKIFDRGLYGLYVEATQQIINWGPEHAKGIALFGVFT